MTDESTDIGWKTRLLRVYAYLLAHDLVRGIVIGAVGVLVVALIIKVL